MEENNFCSKVQPAIWLSFMLSRFLCRDSSTSRNIAKSPKHLHRRKMALADAELRQQAFVPGQLKPPQHRCDWWDSR